MDFETIVVKTVDEIALVTLNRPEKLNAWTYQMGAELRQAIVSANDDPDIIGIVVTGAGRGFCAGADIEAVFAAQQEQDPPYRAEADTDDWVDLVRRSKPIIAAVNGAAIGVGLSQLMAMDRIIASTTAKFSFRFVKMGVSPELASSFYLSQRVGFGAASELMLTGKTITAGEAARLRLVDACVEPQSLIDTAIAAARAMGENPLAAIAETKALLTANIAADSLEAVQARENAALNRCYESPEHHEAIAAFMEKRAPDFRKARG